MSKIHLDFAALAVESFDAGVAGDPSQWGAAQAPCQATLPEICAYGLQAAYPVTCCEIHCDD